MTALELLQTGREWLADKVHWTTGTFILVDAGLQFSERCRIGRAIRMGERDGTVKCCAHGYLRMMDGPHEREATNHLLAAAHEMMRNLGVEPGDYVPLKATMGDGAIAWVNDTLGHDDVLKMYDRAIEFAKGDAE